MPGRSRNLLDRSTRGRTRAWMVDDGERTGSITDGFRLRIAELMKLVLGRSQAARREKALATMAGLVGGLILSRAVDDPELSDEILEATATELGRR